MGALHMTHFMAKEEFLTNILKAACTIKGRSPWILHIHYKANFAAPQGQAFACHCHKKAFSHAISPVLGKYAQRVNIEFTCLRFIVGKRIFRKGFFND